MHNNITADKGIRIKHDLSQKMEIPVKEKSIYPLSFNQETGVPDGRKNFRRL